MAAAAETVSVLGAVVVAGQEAVVEMVVVAVGAFLSKEELVLEPGLIIFQMELSMEMMTGALAVAAVVAFKAAAVVVAIQAVVQEQKF